MKTQPQGSYTKGGGGTSLFGQQPEIYVAPSWTEQALPAVQQFMANWQDKGIDEQEARNEQQARNEATEAYKNFPKLEATRTIPAATLQPDQAGPRRPEMTETYQRSPEEYQGALAEYGSGLDPSNPYMADMQGKVLEKSMGLAGDIAKQDSAYAIKQLVRETAASNPNSLKEFMAMNPGIDMSTPENGKLYTDYVKYYRATDTQKNATAANVSVRELLQFGQNPAASARITAAQKMIEDAGAALYQEATNAGLTGQAAADHVTRRKDELLGIEMQSIKQMFTLGGGQPPSQPPAPQAMVNPAPQLSMPAPASGVGLPNPDPYFDSLPPLLDPAQGRKVPLRSPDDLKLNVEEIWDIKVSAAKGDPSAIETAKRFGIPYDKSVLPQSVAANAAVLPSTPTAPASVLPKTTGRASIPSVDPVKAAEDDQAAKDRASAQVKAKNNMQKLRDGLLQAKRIVDNIKKMPGYSGVGSVWGAATDAITNRTGISTDAGDLANAIAQARANAMGPAYSTLRGTGSVATSEGEAATIAYNRMKMSTSPTEFENAMDDFIINYEKVVAQEEKIANGDKPAPAASAGKTVVRTVKLKNGKTGVEYSDGSQEIK
jgi:hypothetical protein